MFARSESRQEIWDGIGVGHIASDIALARVFVTEKNISWYRKWEILFTLK